MNRISHAIRRVFTTPPPRRAAAAIAAFGAAVCVVVSAASCAISHALYVGADPSPWNAAVDAPPGEDINGAFPEAVYIKTRTQTFNRYWYFVIHDGRVWYKSAETGVGKKPTDWTLFQGDGLLPGGAAAAELSADADELVALSTEGAFYRYCDDVTIAHPSGRWLSKQGWPAVEPLLLDAETARNRAWALGKRNSHVLYYEDIFGNQHHNGTMEIATTYALMEDGQEIRYADTGLPSDFSRTFIGPERGAFKAASLSASGSTMFVINDAGEMYTRLADFDTTGGDPMFFKYTYRPYTQNAPGTEYATNLTEWGLPGEDWRAQPAIPLAGAAAITARITIAQNGQGNAARELRVAGRDETGVTGYWYKQIFDTDWRFRDAPLFFDDAEILDAAASGAGARGTTADRRYSGYQWDDGAREADWTYTIPDFNILEGDCALLVTWCGETCALRLHPVEMWTYLKRDYMPGRGSPPKLYMVTLEIPDGACDGLSDAFVQLLREKFDKNDRVYFQYTLAVTDRFMLLRDYGRTIRVNAAGDTPAYTKGPVIFLTTAAMSKDYRAFAERDLLETSEERQRCYDSDLLVDTASPPSFEELSRAIALNKALRTDLKYQIRVEKWSQLTAFKFNFGYIPAHYIARYSPLRFVEVPKIRTMTTYGARLVLANSAFVYAVSELRVAENAELIAVLDARIRDYERISREVKHDAGR